MPFTHREGGLSPLHGMNNKSKHMYYTINMCTPAKYTKQKARKNPKWGLYGAHTLRQTRAKTMWNSRGECVDMGLLDPSFGFSLPATMMMMMIAATL